MTRPRRGRTQQRRNTRGNQEKTGSTTKAAQAEEAPRDTDQSGTQRGGEKKGNPSHELGRTHGKRTHWKHRKDHHGPQTSRARPRSSYREEGDIEGRKRNLEARRERGERNSRSGDSRGGGEANEAVGPWTGKQSEAMEAARRTGVVEVRFDGRETEEGTEARGLNIAERTPKNKNANVDARPGCSARHSIEEK
jgi:hypothetical protein